MKNAETVDEVKAITDKLDSVRTRISALRDKYSVDALDQNYSKQKHVKCAYVVFRSMEGAARA